MAIVALGGQVERLTDAHFRVRSQSKKRVYNVQWKDGHWTCDCEDFGKTGKPCKHTSSVKWCLLLPSIIVANEPVCLGSEKTDLDPKLLYESDSATVHYLVEFYRRAVAGIWLDPAPKLHRKGETSDG